MKAKSTGQEHPCVAHEGVRGVFDSHFGSNALDSVKVSWEIPSEYGHMDGLVGLVESCTNHVNFSSLKHSFAFV